MRMKTDQGGRGEAGLNAGGGPPSAALKAGSRGGLKELGGRGS